VSPEFEQAALGTVVRRNTAVLAGCMALAWSVIQLFAALAAVTFEVITGRPGIAGLGPAIFLLAWAVATPIMGRVMDTRGRAAGIRSGFLAGVLGSVVIFVGVSEGSTALFLGGLLLVGAGCGTVNLARAGGADMSPPERRARGISLVLLGAALGSIIGPLVFAPLLAGVRHDQSGLAGPWLIAAGIMGLGLLLTFAIRVDPVEIGRRLRGEEGAGGPESSPRDLHELLRVSQVPLALLAAVIAQSVMTTMMSTAAVILLDHGHDLATVSLMLSVHFLGMFGLVLVVGRVVDRVGRVTSIMGGLLALAAGVLGFLGGTGVATILPAMFAIGIGWNLAFVAATAMLSDATRPRERARLIGFSDFAAIGAAAVGSVVALAILNAWGLAPLVIVGAGLAVLPVAAVAARGGVISRPLAR
jgi:MFS family permease